MELVLKLIESHEVGLEATIKRFSEEGGSLGRLPTCFWQLNDSTSSLSREHARIFTQNDLFYLEDTSSNGVFINQSIMPLGSGNSQILSVGDTISMGIYTFLVDSIELQESAVDVPDVVMFEIAGSNSNLDNSATIGNLQSDEVDPLAALFNEDDSLLKHDSEQSEQLFKTAMEHAPDAKGSDEFMAELTGDLCQFGTESSGQSSLRQDIDTHDVVMGGAFNMPETIPDDFSFIDEESKNDSFSAPENGLFEEQRNEPKMGQYGELSDVTQDHNGENTIPVDFVIDLSAPEQPSPFAEGHAAENIIPEEVPENIESEMPTPMLIPDSYIPEMDFLETTEPVKDVSPEASTAVAPYPGNKNSTLQAIDYEKAMKNLLDTLDLDIKDYDSASLNIMLQQIANSIKDLRDDFNAINQKISHNSVDSHNIVNFSSIFEENAKQGIDNSKFLNSLFNHIDLFLKALTNDSQSKGL